MQYLKPALRIAADQAGTYENRKKYIYIHVYMFIANPRNIRKTMQTNKKNLYLNFRNIAINKSRPRRWPMRIVNFLFPDGVERARIVNDFLRWFSKNKTKEVLRFMHYELALCVTFPVSSLSSPLLHAGGSSRLSSYSFPSALRYPPRRISSSIPSYIS